MVFGRTVLRYVFSDGESTLIYECRHCGCTVSSQDEQCPSCGSGGIARYEIQ